MSQYIERIFNNGHVYVLEGYPPNEMMTKNNLFTWKSPSGKEYNSTNYPTDSTFVLSWIDTNNGHHRGNCSFKTIVSQGGAKATLSRQNEQENLTCDFDSMVSLHPSQRTRAVHGESLTSMHSVQPESEQQTYGATLGATNAIEAEPVSAHKLAKWAYIWKGVTVASIRNAAEKVKFENIEHLKLLINFVEAYKFTSIPLISVWYFLNFIGCFHKTVLNDIATGLFWAGREMTGCFGSYDFEDLDLNADLIFAARYQEVIKATPTAIAEHPKTISEACVQGISLDPTDPLRAFVTIIDNLRFIKYSYAFRYESHGIIRDLAEKMKVSNSEGPVRRETTHIAFYKLMLKMFAKDPLSFKVLDKYFSLLKKVNSASNQLKAMRACVPPACLEDPNCKLVELKSVDDIFLEYTDPSVWEHINEQLKFRPGYYKSISCNGCYEKGKNESSKWKFVFRQSGITKHSEMVFYFHCPEHRVDICLNCARRLSTPDIISSALFARR